MKNIDENDQKIIDLLKAHADYTTSEISKKTLLPITTIHNRIKKLKKEGIIKNYTIKLDDKKLGLNVSAFITITVNYNFNSIEKIDQEKIAHMIKKIGAEEVYIVAGGTDIIVKIKAKSIEDLNDFIIKKLRNVHGVDKTQTMIVLQEI